MPRKPIKPTDAINFLKRKKIVPIELWSDISGQEHVHTFTASHIMETDMLETMLGIIVDAKEKGTPRKEVFKNFKNMLEEKKWYLHPDKIGDEEYTNWRLGVIYDTNSRTAYNAGRYRQQTRTSHTRPYLVYKQIQRPTKRVEHSPLHNVCKRFDDPFWNTYYPPNGWGCDCEVRSLTEKQALTGGYNKSPSPDFNPDKDVRPEWRHNPGMEMITPDFNKHKNLSKYKVFDSLTGKTISARKLIQTSYQKEIEEYKLSTIEYKKLVDTVLMRDHQNSIIYYFQNLDDEIATKINFEDSKLTTTDIAIAHVGREGKSELQKLTTIEIKNLSTLVNKPTAIYEDLKDPAIIFINDIGEEKVIKTTFRKDKNCCLALVTSGKVNPKDMNMVSKYKKIY